MATNSITLLNGTVGYASDVELKVNPLYTDIDPSNCDPTFLTGTGKFVLDTNPTITGGTFTPSVFGLANSSTETSVIAASNTAAITIQNTNTTVNNYQSLDFKNDTGAVVGRIASVNEVHTAASEVTHLSFVNMVAGTFTEQFRVSNNGIGVIEGKKVSLDSVDGSGDTYIFSNAANSAQIIVGTAAALTLTSTQVIVGSNEDLVITKKLFFDGGINDYLTSPSNGVLNGVLNGIDTFTWDSSAITSNCLTFGRSGITTGHYINIPNADSLTTGSAINIVSNSADTNDRSLVNIVDDSSVSRNGRCLNIRQDGTATNAVSVNRGANTTSTSCFYIRDDTTGLMLDINKQATTGGNTLAMRVTSANAGAGEGNGIDLTAIKTNVFLFNVDAVDPTGGGGPATGRIPVKIGGATVYLAYY